MRKNSIRKFVHAVLDLIPLFVIPIFAIYTRNENYNSNIEITTSKWEIQNKYETNDVNSYSDVLDNHIYKFKVENLLSFIINEDNLYVNYIYFEDGDGYNTEYSVTNNDQVLYLYTNDDIYLYFDNDGNEPSIMIYSDYVYLASSYFNETFSNATGNASVWIEISDYLPKEYVYNEGYVYNDTDVGSQFVYTLYNTVDKYFNMGNVFNMNDVYDWFVLNIFGGNAPLGLYIVWNIVLYEFVMDLLMLLYSVFMFFIDCCTKLIEKPLNAIK